jgi:hypothetical protein
MYVYVCICMYMYVYVCICMYMYVYVYICMYMYVYVCICMYMYVYVCICLYLCLTINNIIKKKKTRSRSYRAEIDMHNIVLIVCLMGVVI